MGQNDIQYTTILVMIERVDATRASDAHSDRIQFKLTDKCAGPASVWFFSFLIEDRYDDDDRLTCSNYDQ